MAEVIVCDVIVNGNVCSVTFTTARRIKQAQVRTCDIHIYMFLNAKRWQVGWSDPVLPNVQEMNMHS